MVNYGSKARDKSRAYEEMGWAPASVGFSIVMTISRSFELNDSALPLEPTAVEAQATIAEEFAFFNDWSERYQYLIDLGRKLPPFPEEWKTEQHRLQGCQSMVWIVPSGDATRLDFAAVSDSAIVSGLVYLALRVYSGRPANEILATDPDYIAAVGLAKHLSPTRTNGLAALIAAIRDTARRAA